MTSPSIFTSTQPGTPDEEHPTPQTASEGEPPPLVVHVEGEATAHDVVEELALLPGGPVLVVLGGASSMDEPSLMACAPLFESVVAPIVERAGAAVVDGGTDAGVMRLMGRGRRSAGARFPLVGVIPEGAIAMPGAAAAPGQVRTEPNHSHLALVPGDSFGDESRWLAAIAAALAGGETFPALLVNGGEVAIQDAMNVVREGGYVVAVEGSGRTADRIAGALSGSSNDDDLLELIASGMVYAAPLQGDGLADRLNAALGKGREKWPS